MDADTGRESLQRQRSQVENLRQHGYRPLPGLANMPSPVSPSTPKTRTPPPPPPHLRKTLHEKQPFYMEDDALTNRSSLQLGSIDFDNFEHDTIHEELRGLEFGDIVPDMKVNILLCGKTGVGKSSIINSVFGKHVAEVDFGKPVTNEIEQFEDVQMSNHKVHFFDTKGFELNISGERDDGATKMKKFIEKCRWESSKNRIHLVWYLIDCSSARVEKQLRDVCETLLHDLPIIFVLTKIDRVSEKQLAVMKDAIEELKIKNNRGIYGVTNNIERSAFMFPRECPYMLYKCYSAHPEFISKKKPMQLRCNICNSRFSACIGCENAVVFQDPSTDSWWCDNCTKHWIGVLPPENELSDLLKVSGTIIHEIDPTLTLLFYRCLVYSTKRANEATRNVVLMETGSNAISASVAGVQGAISGLREFIDTWKHHKIVL